MARREAARRGRSGCAAGARPWLWSLLAAALWLALVRFPAPDDSLDIDPSWQRAYGHAAASGMQLGRDLLLAHGPLGHLELGTERWDTGRVLLWEGACKLAIALLLAHVVLAIPRRAERIAALALLALLPYHSDSHLLLAVLAAALVLLRRPAGPWLLEACALLVLAALALVKHSLGVAALIGVAGASAAAWRAGDRRRALAGVAGWIAMLLALWRLSGQELAHVPRFLVLALELVRGYSAAMAAPVPGATLAAAVSALILGLALLVHDSLERPRKPAGAASGWLLCALLFLAFKASFVRHAGAGAFGPFAAVGVLLAGACAAQGALRRGLAGALCVCALLALPAWREHGARAPAALLAQRAAQARATLAVLARPAARREELERRRLALAREVDLPRTRAVVGEETVDVFPYQVPLAFLNGLRWQPRPIFQSYSAYTRLLLEANALALVGPRAPRFLLWREGGVDARLEASEDALALQVVARDYVPRLQEGGFLLLERRAQAPEPLPAREPVHAGELALGAWLELDPFRGGPLVLSLDVRPSLAGRLRTALFQGPLLHLEIEDDQGARHRRRLVPELLRAGVIVSPLLKDRDDWIGWHAGGPMREVRALRVAAAPGQRWLVKASIGVRLERVEIAPPADPGVRARTQPQWLPEQAVLVAERTPLPARVGEQEVLVVFAPAEVRLRAGAGRRVLAARYGILDEALAGVQSGEGICFSVRIQGAEGVEREVFARTLDPWRRVEDRGAQVLRAEVELEEGESVLVRTRPVGEAALLDWAWLARVSLE